MKGQREKWGEEGQGGVNWRFLAEQEGAKTK